MKRKLLSFAIAFALLSQTLVSAGALSSAASAWDILRGGTGVLPVEPGATIVTTVTGKVKAHIDASYPTVPTDPPSTTASTFDYAAHIKMDEVRKKFNEYYEVGSDLGSDFGNSIITGQFTITFDVPSTISQLSPASNPYASLSMPAGSIFEFVTPQADTTINPGKVTYIAKVSETTPLKASVLKTNVNTALADFELEVDNLHSSASNQTISVSMEGYVIVKESDGTPYAKITFGSNTSDVIVRKSTGSVPTGGSYTPSGPIIKNDNIVPDNKNIKVVYFEEKEDGVLEIELEGDEDPTAITITSKPAEKDGFIENGYALNPYAGGDPDYTGETYIPDAPVGRRFSLYPRYVNKTVPSALEPETDENGNFLHKVYIAGYPDGEVKPNNDITREEITAAFYRLLNTDYRATIETSEHNFPDVERERWSNDAIATMANGKFVVGDLNGNFNPANPITRAEFAVIASKFAPTDVKPAENYFTDIDEHWAKDYILKVAGQYWISGYADGSFKPDAYITRAEAMTIINRMLVRYGDEDSDYATQWPDVSKSDWYYDSVIEATTHNIYVRTENGWSEKWVEKLTQAAAEPTEEVTEAEAKSDAEAETETTTEEE